MQSGFFVNHHHLALDLELPKVDVDGGSNHIQLVVVTNYALTMMHDDVAIIWGTHVGWCKYSYIEGYIPS